MEPSPLLLESKHKLEEGARSLGELEGLCQGLRQVDPGLMQQVHDIRIQLDLIRGSLDKLVSISGALSASRPELCEPFETISQRVHTLVERIHELRRQVETGARG